MAIAITFSVHAGSSLAKGSQSGFQLPVDFLRTGTCFAPPVDLPAFEEPLFAFDDFSLSMSSRLRFESGSAHRRDCI